MDLKKKYNLKAKNFWRKNQRLIVLISLAAVVGVLLALANTWYYGLTTTKFSLDDPQTISNQEDAEFRFTLEEPALTSVTMEIGLENVQSNANLQLEINGQDLRSVSSNSVVVNLQPGELDNENTIRVYKSQLGFNEQQLVSATVTGTTRIQQLMYVLLNITSIALVFLPIGYIKYEQYQERKQIEDEFPGFLRDVVQGTRAGMSLPQAIQNTESGSYGPLDERIENMSAQIEWGIPFDEVLTNFSKDINSPLIKRSTDTIIQAYTSGGNIQDVLDSVGDNIRSIKQLKEERQSQLYGEMITGYIVYFIFIGILVALTTFLLPNLATASQSLGGSLNVLGGGGGSSLQENINLYNEWFKRLVYIQALFSGLIIGKLSEGELKAGLKHSGILFAAGYLAVTFFL